MNLYVESSALLAWLLSEPLGWAVEEALLKSDQVIASDLTLIECDRALLRITRLDPARQIAVGAIQARFAEVSETWHLEPIGASVVDRARQPFPKDPLRTLDAIHLASALVARSAVGDLHVLSLDERVRSNAVALGFRVLPD